LTANLTGAKIHRLSLQTSYRGKDFSSEKSSRTDHSPKGCALQSKVCFSHPILKQSPTVPWKSKIE